MWSGYPTREAMQGGRLKVRKEFWTMIEVDIKQNFA